jgi:hypothetical protein
VKKYVGPDGNADQERIATEAASNAIYQELGVPVPAGGFIERDGSRSYGYAMIDGELRPDLVRPDNADLHQGYAAHAFLANWDFVGLDRDNILFDKEGKPIFLDQGGTMSFRAMGESKDFKAGFPDELYSLIDQGQGKGNIGITAPEVYKQVDDLVDTMTDEKIDAIVDAAGFDTANTLRMKATLKTRRDALSNWLRDPGTANALGEHFPITKGTKSGISRKINKKAGIKAKTKSDLAKGFVAEQGRITSRKRLLTPADIGDMDWWVIHGIDGGQGVSFSWHVRTFGKEGRLDELEPFFKEKMKKLDALIDNEVITNDITVYRGIKGMQMRDFLTRYGITGVGDEFVDHGYGASNAEGDGMDFAKNWAKGWNHSHDGFFLEIDAPSGTHALNIAEKSGQAYSEGELLFKRKLRFATLEIDETNHRLRVRVVDDGPEPVDVKAPAVPELARVNKPELADRRAKLRADVTTDEQTGWDLYEKDPVKWNRALARGEKNGRAISKIIDRLFAKSDKSDHEMEVFAAIDHTALPSADVGTIWEPLHYVNTSVDPFDTAHGGFLSDGRRMVRVIVPAGTRYVPGADGPLLNRSKYRLVSVGADGIVTVEMT